jgi:hypothetical protein
VPVTDSKEMTEWTFWQRIQNCCAKTSRKY